MLRLALLSFWHVHAYDYARESDAHEDAEIVGVWDEVVGRGKLEAEARGVPFYESLEGVLSSPDADGVVVTTPTTAHREVLAAALRAGKHVFTEKAIAPTLRETQEIVAEAERAGITFAVSLPRLYAGYARAIREVIGGGMLGEVTHARVRVSHDGAVRTAEHPGGWLPAHFFEPIEAAGGVLTDFGCHPLYLLRLFLGMPESVSASYGYATGRAVEDNAAVTLRYADGALGVAEASFLGSHSPFEVEVHGTGGSLLYGPPDERLLLRAAGSDGWAVLDLPPDGPSPFELWVDHALRGEPMPENVHIATDLSSLVEASNLSAAEGRVVRLDSLAHAGRKDES